MDPQANDLFSLPEFEQQDELLTFAPVVRDVKSTVDNPVAHVRLDMPQPHMDRPFDYEIPPKYADVEVGAKVLVDVGGRKREGFIVARDSTTNVGGRLRPISRVISHLPLLSSQVEELCIEVGAKQVAPVADCLRLAVPQRHARAEKEFLQLPARTHKSWNAPSDPGSFADFDSGAAYLGHLIAGEAVNGICYMQSDNVLSNLLAPAIQAVLHNEKGALVVVPTPAQARNLSVALAQLLPDEPIATMISEDDHASRYREFLAVRSGRVRVVVGSRSAAWAPVENLGLVAIADDMHSALAEPRSPYVHSRDLLVLRATLADAAFLGFTMGPSLKMAALVESGWARPLLPSRATISRSSPQILDAHHFAYEGSAWSRMPSSVFSVVREGLESGPVLMVVPRSGYIPLVACHRCRELASCRTCGGQMGISAPDQPLRCELCGDIERSFTCPHCAGTEVRAVRIGSHRTAQEVGRAFRSVPIHVTGVGESIHKLDSHSRIVVSTPGIEPEVAGGYSSGVVLDAGYLLRSTRLDSESYFLRTIAHTATRIRSRANGGKLLIVGNVPGDLLHVAATWDFHSWGLEQLQERRILGQPPTKTWIEVTGPWDELRTFLSTLRAHAAESGLPQGDSNAPLDVILTGGLHDLIPGMSVLGPSQTRSGMTQVYLRFDNHEQNTRLPVIRAALNAVSIGGTAPKLRLKAHPDL